jgi:hypothetical protein
MQPLQECMIVLAYLKGHPQDGESRLLRYLLSEIFELFKAHDDEEDDGLSLNRTSRRYEAPWQILHKMRDEATAGFDKDVLSRRRVYDPSVSLTSNSQPAPSQTQRCFPSAESEKNERGGLSFTPLNPNQDRFYQTTPSARAPPGTFSAAPASSNANGTTLDGPFHVERQDGHPHIIPTSQEDYSRPRHQTHVGQSCSCVAGVHPSRENGPASTESQADSNTGPQSQAQSSWNSSHALEPVDDMPGDWLDILEI